jgi:PAS domain S-box-containing protein
MDIQPDHDIPAVHPALAEVEPAAPALGPSLLALQAAEQELRRSQDRFDALVRATGQIIWTTNAAGLVEEDLPAWRAYTGQSAEAMKGWGWLEAVHPDGRERVSRVWSQAVATREPYEVEYRLHRCDGVYRTFLVRAVPVLEPDDSVREWVGSNTDITERQQMLEEQARRLERQQAIRRELETALDALLQIAQALVWLPDAQDQTSEAQAPALAYGVVRRLAELARSALGCKTIRIVFLEPETQAFQPVVAVGIPPDQEQVWRSAVQGGCLSAYFTPQSVTRLRAGEAIVVDETAVLLDHPLRSYAIPRFLALPLHLGAGLMGGMIVDYGAQAHDYTADEIALAGAVARLIAVVLDREQLATQSGRRSAELATASLAIRAVAQQWDIDQVLGSVLEQAKGVLGTTMAALLVLDPAQRALKLLSACGVLPEIRERLGNLKIGMDTFLGRAALSEAVHAVEDVQASKLENAPLVTLLAAEGIGSFLVVPLAAQHRPVGVLAFASPLARPYDAEARHFLRLLGDIFAVAINAASLQDRLRQSNAQLVTASLQAQQRAESLEEEKEERERFISLVAHELGTPLTALSGYIQMLEGPRVQQPERREAMLHTMREQANRLKRLIDDLLDVTRIASGHFAIKPEVTDLAYLARNVVEEAQSTTSIHTIRLDLASESIIGVWDRQRMTQVLSNLLANAIKYSPKGGEIRVAMEFEPEGVQVTIEDHGVGLTPEEIALLFRAYARLDRTRKTLGSGLGLYITRGIIEAHGGRIWATSPGPGCGSAFTFLLPYQAPRTGGH